MLYRIVYGGSDIWVPQTKDVLSPTVEIELNTAGRLTFTLTPEHPDFYTIEPLKGTVEVYENSDLIWFGRPVSLERNIRNEKPVYCEGALAYFNDSAQRPRAKGNTTAAALFASILQVHNAQVPTDRQFTAGTVDMPSDALTWENDYESTFSAVLDMLDQAGGYLIPRRVGSVNYLDFLQKLPLDSGQPMEYSVNLTDFRREYDFSGKITAVLPVGGVPEGETAPVTIASVNSGSDILDSDAVSTLGRIVKTISFREVTDPNVLKAAAQKYLDNAVFSPITISAKAVDLSFVDSQYFPFRVGRQYYINSTPHDVAEWLPLKRLSIRMDSAVREIEMESNRDSSGAVLVELIVVYLYMGIELGQESHFFPVGYAYTIELPYLDLTGDGHQIVYRPLQSSLSGTVPEHVVYQRITTNYDIALDLTQETGIMNTISVDSFTLDSSSGVNIGVIA